MVRIGDVSFIDNSRVAEDILRETEIEVLMEYGYMWKNAVEEIIVEKNIINTGTLFDSMDWDIDVEKKEIKVGTNVHYAIYQELGTAFIQARPFLVPSVQQANQGLAQLVEETVEGGIFTRLRTRSLY